MAESNACVDRNYSHRKLTEHEVDKLKKDTELISDYKRNKLEKEAKKNWDLFYKRNTTKFFKDRHWTKREFEELCGNEDSSEKQVILEIGCGVGNFLFPLLEEDLETQFFFYACDFSPRAIEFVKQNPRYDTSRCHAFTCDITQDDILQEVPTESVDIATLIFVMSAISPDKIIAAIKNLDKVVKPGGMVLFRDYGLYDHAMMRFATGHKISEHFYVRQDGTRAYYFTEDEVSDLFCSCGYETVNSQYVFRKTINKKEGIDAERIFVQAKFRKIPRTTVDLQSTGPDKNHQTIEQQHNSGCMEQAQIGESDICVNKKQFENNLDCVPSTNVDSIDFSKHLALKTDKESSLENIENGSQT